MNNWSKRPVVWEDDQAVYYSVAFTWQLADLAKTLQPRLDQKRIVIGGPAVKLMPGLAPGWAGIADDPPPGVNPLALHNSLATRTSRGCPNNCGFCAVPRMHGELRELADWEAKPIICDDNLLACSRRHFDQAIDKIRNLEYVDFNQGLDCRRLTKHHARRLAEIRNPIIRLALDRMEQADDFFKAFCNLREQCIPKKHIRAYALIGYDEPPDHALKRLEMIASLGIKPNPMRYQPINATEKNACIAPGWTACELDRFMSYWSNLRFTASVPFADYRHHKRVESGQLYL
jgi:hypothetical protein